MAYKKLSPSETLFLSLFLFYLNTCFLNKYFDDLEYLIKTMSQTFDTIAISESRIKSNMDITTNIDLPNYFVEYTPTESHAGGTLPYISNNIVYKPRKDLNIYKTCELESTFTKIINPKKSNIILSVVYQHPAMDLNEFNDKYVNKLLDNITKENKTTFLLGVFNIDLLKYDSQTSTYNFLDSFSSNMVLPYILHPTIVTDHSKTLIDNLCSNYIFKAICENSTSTISDHLPQFLIMPSVFSDPSLSKSNVYEKS